MSKRHARHRTSYGRWLAASRVWLLSALGRTWQRIRESRQTVPVEVLVADRTRRRALERELRWGLGRLRRALGAPLPPELTVLVQQIISTDRQLAGCYQLGQRTDGTRFALVRLALQVDGRCLTSDELLAVLAEQLIGLATQQSTGVLVPIDLAPGVPPESRSALVLRPDPLTPRTNGTIGGSQAA
ncbi:MAG TPA: hypothetical protein VNL16_18800 [Chloroflexota bacterium]|nr:hypothetical protein [Chloroflexota bacterium]